ncbi:MAG TPA: hypothetical protein VF723_03315 [Pyrinomonadaceae bacterium]|jgi:hypothetical protein
MKKFLYSLFVISCLGGLLWARPAATASEGGRPASGSPGMPRQCRTGKTSPESLGRRWRPSATVRVSYLKGNFNEAEIRALSRAINKWNDALREIGSGITFINGSERESPAEDNGSITVMRGNPRGKERLGELKFYSLSNGTTYMSVIISPVVRELNALTSLMTHEIGHSLGLADCYECQHGTTAMAAFKDKNTDNGVYEPSACDKYVVSAGYAGGAAAHALLAPAARR